MQKSTENKVQFLLNFFKSLKEQSHEKVGEIRALDGSLGSYKEQQLVFKFF
jgi:hypothetical protein